MSTVDGEWASADADSPAGPVYGGQAVGPAAVILDDGAPFAVVSIRLSWDAGLIVARLEAVRRQPFDLHVLGEFEAARLTGFDPAGEEVLVLTDRGPLRVRGLRRPDAEWLSDTGLSDLPGEQLEALARALHVAESEDGDEPWAAFDVPDIDPVEFLQAHVCARTGGVFALSYYAAVNEWQPAKRTWRRGGWHSGDWESEPPIDTDCWRRDGPEEGDEVREYRIATGTAARFVKAFDNGQWISEDAAIVAAGGGEEDFTVHHLTPRLAARLGVLLRDATPEEIDADTLLMFADGRARLAGDLLLDLLLTVDTATVAALPAEHPWAWDEDVEILLGVWDGFRRRLAATVAVAIPSRDGGIVRAEVFPEFASEGLVLLRCAWDMDSRPDFGNAETWRRDLSLMCAASIAEQWPRLTAPMRGDEATREEFADLPQRALMDLLGRPFTMTLWLTFLVPFPIDFGEFVRERRREMPTPSEWSELAGRLEAPPDDSAPEGAEEQLPFGGRRTH